jgi:hypothetical protein
MIAIAAPVQDPEPLRQDPANQLRQALAQVLLQPLGGYVPEIHLQAAEPQNPARPIAGIQHPLQVPEQRRLRAP